MLHTKEMTNPTERLKKIEECNAKECLTTVAITADVKWLIQTCRDAILMAEFYGDRENWNISDPNGSSHVIHPIDVDDETNFGGKRARDFLEKVKGGT